MDREFLRVSLNVYCCKSIHTVVSSIYTGTWLGVGIHAMHRDPSVWNDPEVSIYSCRDIEYHLHTLSRIYIFRDLIR